MKIYTWTDGTEYDELPGSMGNTSPVSEQWWTAHGGTIEERPDPPEPIPDTTERDNAEKAIVGRIAALALKYDALADLANLELTIPSLLQLAAAKQVNDADMQAVKSDVAILVLDLMAKEGGDWAGCWDGLKSRFPQWLQELNASMA